MSKNNTLISVAIPAYKAEFLEEAIQSLLRQTYEHFELIIVNDASPEDVDSVVESFTDPRIFYYKNKKNLGCNDPTKNWNKCLEYAQGELFVLFADDDIYHQDFLKELYSLSCRYPHVNLFHSRVELIDSKGDSLRLSPICPEYEEPLDFIWHRINGHRLQFAADFMCRTSFLKKINGFYSMPLAWGSDDITWFQLSLKSGVCYSAKPLFKFRISDNHISSSGNIHDKLNANRIYIKWIKSFVNTCIWNDRISIILISMIKNKLSALEINKDQSDVLSSSHRYNLIRIIKILTSLKTCKCSRAKLFLKIINKKYLTNI